MKSIAVYCASSATLEPIYHNAAAALGREIVAAGASLVCGGGRTGLMGEVANAVLVAGGTATGVIPEFMKQRGWHHTGMSELRVVGTMHERKALMMELATGIVALPGGIGTFEEFFEAITWRQLGLFGGNIALYNVEGYYDPMISMFETAIERGFMRPDHRNLFRVVTSAREAVEYALAEPADTVFSPKF